MHKYGPLSNRIEYNDHQDLKEEEMSEQPICFSSDHKGSMRKINGWFYLTLAGSPYEIGLQHGELLGHYIAQTIEEIKQLVLIYTGMPWDFFKKHALRMWQSKLTESLEKELKGIVAGVNQVTCEQLAIDFGDLLTWNGFEELTGYWFPTVIHEVYNKLPGCPDVVSRKVPLETDDHCSAFIANGDYTKGGKIIAAHNTFSNFEQGHYCNVVLDITPDKGYPIKMQAQPGYIHSVTDFYVTGANLVITETTIGGFCVYAEDKTPEFIRIRLAAQYANSLDAFCDYLLTDNNGGYANTWLVGDYNTGEIMRFELGLKFYQVDKTYNGYFVGFNAPINPRIRHLECNHSGFADIRRHQGARQVRIPQLLEEHKGTIDLETAKRILSDHFDVYTGQVNPCSRTICSHYELDPREYMSQADRPVPFAPRGAVDGIVCSSETMAHRGFVGRFGSSCGRAFSAQRFLKQHPQFDYLKPFLKDRPTMPWTVFF